jgi:hypothetical protein
MIRTEARSLKMQSVVLAVACAMLASVIGAGGYVFLHHGPDLVLAVATPLPGLLPHDVTGEEDSDSHNASSSSLGMMALGESFAPMVFPPPDRGMISPISVHIHRSAHVSRIFHPPIV